MIHFLRWQNQWRALTDTRAWTLPCRVRNEAGLCSRPISGHTHARAQPDRRERHGHRNTLSTHEYTLWFFQKVRVQYSWKYIHAGHGRYSQMPLCQTPGWMYTPFPSGTANAVMSAGSMSSPCEAFPRLNACTTRKIIGCLGVRGQSAKTECTQIPKFRMVAIERTHHTTKAIGVCGQNSCPPSGW